MNPPTISYNPRVHSYTVNGQPVPSITEVCRVFMPDYRFASTTFGTTVHAYTAALDTGLIAESDPHGGEVVAWLKFKRDFNVVCQHTEEMVADPRLRFAGRVDRFVLWKNDEPAVIDIKTGAEAGWHAIQLAGAELGAKAMGWMEGHVSLARVGVYLRSNGDYRVRVHEDRADHTAFVAALSVLHTRRNLKLDEPAAIYEREQAARSAKVIPFVPKNLAPDTRGGEW